MNMMLHYNSQGIATQPACISLAASCLNVSPAECKTSFSSDLLCVLFTCCVYTRESATCSVFPWPALCSRDLLCVPVASCPAVLSALWDVEDSVLSPWGSPAPCTCPAIFQWAGAASPGWPKTLGIIGARVQQNIGELLSALLIMT